MGILNSGIFGGFRKKTGPIIGRRSRGQNIITSLHHTSNKPRTDLQLDSQDKFGMLNMFLGNIAELVNIGFKSYVKKNSPVNAAYKYNYKHAFVLQQDQWILNYPMLVYSRGHVSGPQGAVAGLLSDPETGHLVAFSWQLQTQSDYCRFTDQATFLAYSPSMNRRFMAQDAADRYAQEFKLLLPPDFDAGPLHCYMSFRSKEGAQVGNSHYIGLLG
jgi:hypothetical protein